MGRTRTTPVRMASPRRRPPVVLLVALALLSVGFATPAGAHAGPSQPAGSQPDTGNQVGDGDNSSFTIAVDLNRGPGGGSLSIECEGTPRRHSCDKGGDLHGGPVTVDYVGDNHGNFPARTGGGGDKVTLTVAGREFLAFFDCEFGPGPPDEGSCTGDAITPAGDVPI